MKHLSMAIVAAALLLGSGTVWAQELVDCKMPNENANSIAFFSANTNSGKGNGKEHAILLYDGALIFCLANGPGDDREELDGNAAVPLIQLNDDGSTFSVSASDPGNSPN